MENKFKVLNLENKEFNSGTHPLQTKFSQAIFPAHWAFQSFLESAKPQESTEGIESNEIEIEKPVETILFQEAVAKISELVNESQLPISRDSIELSNSSRSVFVVSEDFIKNSTDTQSKILFIGLTKNSSSLELDSRQVELVSNMAKALEIEESEREFYGISVEALENDELYLQNFEENTELNNLVRYILTHKPLFMFSFGAQVSNFLIKRKEKLNQLHGNIIEIRFLNKLNEIVFSTKLMPLFHPELLLINPNMKKTTWIDLQKSKDFIGKK